MVAAVVLQTTGFRLVDPICGVLIGLFVLPRTMRSDEAGPVTHSVFDVPRMDSVVVRRRLHSPDAEPPVYPPPMASPAKRPATYDDLLHVPDHQVGEIVGGELHVSPRSASRHALASSGLGSTSGPPFQHGRGGPGGWWVIDETELHLGTDVLVPDLAAWRRERMPAFPDSPAFSLAPDWVCEVVSLGRKPGRRATPGRVEEDSLLR